MKIVSMISFCLLFFSNNLFSQYYSQEDSVGIAEQLNSIHQANFAVNVILNVDSVTYNYYYSEGRISDPYNTLNGCLVFLAAQIIDSQSFGNSILGIYRENQILWSSNETIKPSYLSFGKIYGIIELNDDVKIDILSQWVDIRDNYNQKYLWIFSWDGNTGSCINDGDNISRVSTHGYSNFELVDIEGDGIWEIVGFGAKEEFAFVPEIYKWDGSKYSLSNITINTLDYFFPRNNIVANVNSIVAKPNDSTFKYTYAITNDNLSKQGINEFYLEKDSDSMFNTLASNGWNEAIYDSLFKWYDTSYYSAKGIYITENLINPGVESHFSYESFSLPGIQNYYLRGYNFPNLDPENSTSEYYDIFENSNIGATIGPRDMMNPFVPLDFIDTLLNYNTRSFELGWITNQTTADKYDILFSTAKTQLQQNNNNAVRATLQTVLQEVDIDSTNNLTSEAYALLRYNTEYLIEKLPLQSQLNLDVINPSMSMKNPGAFTMDLEGSGFSSNSVVYFNGQARATTLASDDTLNAEILASDVSEVGNFPVWVSDGTTNSDTLMFSVVNSLPKEILPIMNCVMNNGNGTYTAYFGYNNKNSVSVYVPVYSQNKISPEPWDRGQPGVFKVGVWERVFSVTWSSGNIIWHLNNNTAKAKTNSPPCQ